MYTIQNQWTVESTVSLLYLTGFKKRKIESKQERKEVEEKTAFFYFWAGFKFTEFPKSKKRGKGGKGNYFCDFLQRASKKVGEYI